MNREPPLSRRRLLTAGAGALAAGAVPGLAAAGCAAPSFTAEGKTRLRYWHLFGGGDGANMTAMVDAFDAEHPDIDMQATQLDWGPPYYTKLGMAGAGGRAPEVGVLHLTRLAGFGPGKLLDPFDPGRLEAHGITPDRFPPEIWRRGQVDGEQYAIPLDTHPIVLYYHTEICEEAGLLTDDGGLKPIRGVRAFVEALHTAKEVTGAPPLVAETLGTDTVTPWRLFNTFYSQSGGTVLSEDGTRITIDDAKAMEVLEFMAMLTDEGLMVRRADYPGSVGIFGAGETAFSLNGEWEVTTYTTNKLPFSMTRVPALFGRPTVYADSHSFVLPHQATRSDAANEAGYAFVAWMLEHSVDWAEGGHVPAYLPTLDDPAYLELQPQSAYRSVIDDVVLDPAVWFAGSASLLQIELGAVFSSVFTGSRSPQGALREAKSRLRKLLDTPDPIGGAV